MSLAGKAQIVERPSELTNVLWRASRGGLGRRNVAIIWTLFGAGMRINEVAQLQVKDVYRPNGELKKTFIIPAKYTKTHKSRVAYIVAAQQRQALNEWRTYRVDENEMLSDEGSYGNLRGDSPLFLSKKGPGVSLHSMQQNTKQKAVSTIRFGGKKLEQANHHE